MDRNSYPFYKVSDNIELSLVIPAFNEETNIEKLYQNLIDVLKFVDMSWEIILSDDGSRDKTWETITSLHKKDNRLKGIRFSRNFGHQYALFAGLLHSSGKAIVCMDADLQHPPDLIPKLISEWRKGNKIVNTIRLDQRNTSYIKKISSKFYYKIWAYLSGVEIGQGMADFRLLDRQVVDDILKFKEVDLFLRGIVQWVGYQSSQIRYQCQNRFSGKSKYTYKKMVKLAISGVISFSIIPLRLGILIGIVTAFLAFAEIVYAIYAKLVLGTTFPGWTSAISILSFLFGILFILLGLIGEYIGRILVEVKRRPRFLISEGIGFD
jgi:dolichol-phosphate mannosyltransferase